MARALHRAAPGLAWAWWILARHPRRAAGGAGRRHRRGRRRGQRRRAARLAARRGEHRPGGDADPPAAAPGRRRQPRQLHGELAERRARRRVRQPARRRPPGGSRAGRRPGHRSGLRPRHHGPAAVHLDGLHRQRPRRPARRARRGDRARPLRVVGADPARAWRGAAPTGCCARAACGATANTPPVQLAQRHADYAYRLAVDAPASKEVRVFVLGDWVVESLRRLGAPAARPEVGGDAAARALAGVVPADRAGGERAGVLGDRATPRSTDASASAPRSRSPRPRSPPACSPSAA